MARKTNQIGEAEPPKPSGTSATDWMNVIEATRTWRRKIAREARWDDFIKEYEGKWDHIQKGLTIPLLPMNLVFAFVKTEISRLYFQDPYLSVNAKRRQDLGPAHIAEAALNSVWHELHLKEEFKRALIDAIVVGHGWIKVGYSAEFGIQEAEPEIRKKGPGRPRSRESVKDVVVNEYIKSDNVFAYHYPWRDVLFSPMAKHPPTDGRFMAFRSVRPLRSVKQSKIFSNTADLEPSGTDLIEFKGLEKFERSVVLWEIWDKDFNKVYTVAENHDKVLSEIKWPYSIEGFPVSMVGFNESMSNPYPLSDISMFEPQIIELMKMASIIMNHLKRWNRQILMPKGLMTDEDKQKFTMGVDGSVIEYEPTGREGGIIIPPYAPVQQDVYAAWNLFMDIWKTVAGQSDVERGGPARSQSRTVGELRLSLQGGKSRASEKIDSLENSIEDVGKKLLSIMQQKLTVPKLIARVGPKKIQDELLRARQSAQNNPNQSETSGNGFTFNREDISGELDVKVVAGSTVPLDKSNKLDIFTQMMELFPNIGIQPGGVASIELGREILRQIDVKELDHIMDLALAEKAQADKQPTREERAAQAQMQAQAAKLQASVHERQARTQEEQAKTQLGVQKTKVQMEKSLLDSILNRIRNANEIQEERVETERILAEAERNRSEANNGE